MLKELSIALYDFPSGYIPAVPHAATVKMAAIMHSVSAYGGCVD
jgi:hypothetical protein